VSVAIVVAGQLAQDTDVNPLRLVDEPANSLHTSHGEEIMRILRRMTDEGTAVVC
jgi:ABC-type hemin transport system ATPase subunit